ncbi:phosphatidylserine decarboxylase [Saccharopolyspora lacisalsi]|uniref:Phosphatidylserine decarboxylase n=1 Tax=Halosaccharopolyspora lacisalsi TaxID=1000566 RepID=A0A839DYG1_9PSEU|nr:phosphatidylserine decarboxylase [Halosaccharopolyspora lacisalsi]MBA8825256.1 phosphatidylserine decarboxylase [Halosaccharopolyspora lacisalsi]
MAKTLEEWVDTAVRPVSDRSPNWLAENYFFRDPARPRISDNGYFLSPADGIVLHQRIVDPSERVLDIKGENHSIRHVLRDESYDRRSMVIGVFTTCYDVHVNRVPYSGRLSYWELPAISGLDLPTLDVEMLGVDKSLLQQLKLAPDSAEHPHHNQRVVNKVHAPELAQSYYVIQIADHDVDAITPFGLSQNRPVGQGGRFSQIRYGSQVELVVPLSRCFDFEFVQRDGAHVESGIDPLVSVRGRRRYLRPIRGKESREQSEPVETSGLPAQRAVFL